MRWVFPPALSVLSTIAFSFPLQSHPVNVLTSFDLRLFMMQIHVFMFINKHSIATISILISFGEPLFLMTNSTFKFLGFLRSLGSCPASIVEFRGLIYSSSWGFFHFFPLVNIFRIGDYYLCLFKYFQTFIDVELFWDFMR